MNVVLAKLYDKVVTKFNDDITGGFAVKELDGVLDYIDNVFKSSMKSSSPLLQYNGYERLTYMEEANLLIKKNSAPKEFDVANTDTYMVRLLVSYNGEEIPNVNIPIPFVRDGGIMDISGTPYSIVPVLTDTVISPTDKNVFVRLLCDKLIIESASRNFLKNGDIKIARIIYSNALHRVRLKGNDLGDVVNPAALYLFGKFGLVKSFEDRTGLTPVVTTNEDSIKYKETHDIYTSTKIKPRKLKADVYIPHNICICVPKSKNELSEALAFSFLYTLDMLPNVAEGIRAVLEDNDVEKEIKYWRYIMSRLIFKDTYSPDKGVADVDNQYITLNSYIDPITMKRLSEADMEVSDIFDLISLLLINYSYWLSKGKEFSNNIFNRYIDILYYLLYDYVVGIHKVISDITRFDSSSSAPMLPNKVKRLFNAHLSPRTIYKVTTGGINIALVHAASISDNMYMKFTSTMELQERGEGVKRGTKNQFPVSVRTITGHELYSSSMLYLPKPCPTGQVKVNPTARFTETGRIDPDPALVKDLDLLDDLLKGRISNDPKIIKELINTTKEDGIGDAD